MAYNKISWMDFAVSEVKFTPDRKAIKKELSDHIDDKIDALTGAGIPQSIASKRALEAMGDPIEVGKALNKAHSPFWGWLWSITRFCAIFLVIVTIITAAVKSSDIFEHLPLKPQYLIWGFDNYSVSVPEKFKVGDFTIEPVAAEVYSTGNGYNLSVDIKIHRSLVCGCSPNFLSFLTSDNRKIELGAYERYGFCHLTSSYFDGYMNPFDEFIHGNTWHINLQIFDVEPDSVITIGCELNDEFSMRFEL